MACPDEQTILDFLEGTLDREKLEAFERHLDACPACQAAVVALVRKTGHSRGGTVRSPTDALLDLERGTSLGRYIVLHKLGAGGMGVVYAAYDPELDRKIALKLLHANGGDNVADAEARTRLLREAQAMAKLSHPNVVPVHDVGTFDGHVFIAMEYLAGGTLRCWLEDRNHTWQQVRDVFVQAGRGLSAAHRAGLVHRDFKPDNVLMTAEGVVRVTDFGLARQVDEATTAGTEQPTAGTPPGPLDAKLTRTGAAMGTPVYMAPEQYAGAPSVLTDQFNFCAALYHGLYGRLPFEGENIKEIARAASQGDISAPPRGSNVPGWLRKILLRGLSPAPADRFDTMRGLLAALDSDPASGRRRRWVLVVSILVVLGLVAFGVFKWTRHRAGLCTGAAAEFAQVWHPARKAEIRTAFMNTQSPLAADAWARVERGLDAYASNWAAVHTEACRSTRMHGERSEAMFDRQMTCLQRRLLEVRALVALFAQADERLVQRVAKAVQVLGSPGACNDIQALATGVAPPADAGVREEVDACSKQIAAARALKVTGRVREALEEIRGAVARARKTGYGPTLAEALLLQGQYEDATGDARAAASVLGEALHAAEAAGASRIAARAWTELAWVEGYRLKNFEAGLQHARHAEAYLQQLGNPDLPAAYLHNHLGGICYGQGKFEDALREHGLALKHRQAGLGPGHPDVGISLCNLGMVYRALGRYQQAGEQYRKALELMEQSLGPHHPDLALVLGNFGNLLLDQDDFAGATAKYKQALAIREKVLGPDHPATGRVLNNLGYALWYQGERKESLAAQRRALAVAEAAHGPDHPAVAYALEGLAGSLSELDQEDESRTTYERALRILEARYGRDHRETALVMNNLGIEHMRRGQLDRARQLLEESLRVRTASYGEKHRYVASTIKSLGVLAYRRGHYEQARRHFERAYAILVEVHGSSHAKAVGTLAWIARTHLLQGTPEARAAADRALVAARARADDRCLVDGLAVMGLALLAGGDRAAARQLLEQAVQVGEARRMLPLDLAEARFALARALPAAERSRARALAEVARKAYAATGWKERPALGRILAWQRKHNGP